MTSTHKGDTIRLKASFYTFAGALADPSDVSVTIYDSSRTVLVTGIPTKEVTGVYYYDYTTPAEGRFPFEFTGTLEGKTILARDGFSVGW